MNLQYDEKDGIAGSWGQLHILRCRVWQFAFMTALLISRTAAVVTSRDMRLKMNEATCHARDVAAGFEGYTVQGLMVVTLKESYATSGNIRASPRYGSVQAGK